VNVGLVTIGLPVFNGESYLETALNSALAQQDADIELVISDNFSSDRTEEICRDHAANDPRIRYHRQTSNRGPAWNHNFVVWVARGEYFRWFAYDDILDPRLIARCSEVLDSDQTTILAYPETTVIDADGHVIEQYRTDLPWQGDDPITRLKNLLLPLKRDSLLAFCYPIYGLMRRDVLMRTTLMQPYHSADNPLLVELALRGRWIQVPERLFYSRRHQLSSTVYRTSQQTQQWFTPWKSVGERDPLVLANIFKGYLRAISRAPLTARERAEGLRVLAAWLRRERNGRKIIHELRSAGFHRGS